MTSTRVIQPHVYAHAARPEWGYAVIAEHFSDRTKYVFENAGERTLMNEPYRLHEVDLPSEEREALAKKLLRQYSPRSKRKKVATAKTPIGITFDDQEAAFLARFPEGFASDKYVLEQRSAVDGEGGTSLDALIATARQLLSAQRLDASLARKAYEDVYADAVQVLAAAQRLAFPKADKPTFTRMPENGHERFAITLRDLLYGTGDYAVRFNAFVKSLGAKGVPWTIATIFSASVHPADHVLVKPLQSQRQARVLERTDPPVGAPSGAGYAKHLATAHALRDRLIAAGHAPRDLFDVYVYQWRTLSKGGFAPSDAAAIES